MSFEKHLLEEFIFDKTSGYEKLHLAANINYLSPSDWLLEKHTLIEGRRKYCLLLLTIYDNYMNA